MLDLSGIYISETLTLQMISKITVQYKFMQIKLSLGEYESRHSGFARFH